MHCHGIGNPDDLWLNPQSVPHFIGYHTVFTSFIGQAKVFFGVTAQHCASVNPIIAV
jgi:hypothetical protein